MAPRPDLGTPEDLGPTRQSGRAAPAPDFAVASPAPDFAVASPATGGGSEEEQPPRSPWPELPDDTELWTPAVTLPGLRDAAHERRLDDEQRGR